MTHDDLTILLKHPDSIEEKYLPHLKEILIIHPYFSTARLIHSKSLVDSKDIQFSSNVKISNLYTASRSWFYYYLFPERQLSTGKYRKEKLVKSSGDYFDMIDSLESQGDNNKNTLRNIAERLKSARNLVTKTPLTKQTLSVDKSVLVEETLSVHCDGINSDLTSNSVHIANFDAPEVLEINFSLEQTSKKLISERKYSEAIEILKHLNLNNPKKSVYFADQIRFLEKIIANTQK